MKKHVYDKPIVLDEVEIPNSDGYVYVIAFDRIDDGERFYYVGKSTALENRFTSHRTGTNDFQAPLKPNEHDFDLGLKIQPKEIDQGFDKSTEDEYLVSSNQIDLEPVGLVRLYEIDQHGHERRDRFNQRLLNHEREVAYETAIEMETVNVLGGH